MATTYKIIDKTILGSSASSVSFTSIPSTYTDLKLVVSVRGTANTIGTSIKLNSSTSNYTWLQFYGTGSSAASGAGSSLYYQGFFQTPSTYTANSFNSGEVYFPNYASSNYKSFSVDSVVETNATLTYMEIGANLWSDNSAINSIEMYPDVGGFDTGSSFYLYGIKNS